MSLLTSHPVRLVLWDRVRYGSLPSVSVTPFYPFSEFTPSWSNSTPYCRTLSRLCIYIYRDSVWYIRNYPSCPHYHRLFVNPFSKVPFRPPFLNNPDFHSGL